jgi:conjugal transfer mating pair stabilization protein TraN
MKVNLIILGSLIFTANTATANITCFNPKEECVEGSGTRNVGSNNDIPLTLPCWRYRTTYECKAISDNNCRQLAAQGCLPTTATCRTKWAGVCAVQDVVYGCPTRICDGYGIVCNDGTGFCLKGNCMLQVREKANEQDMHRALSALSAAAEASKSFSHDLSIFKGVSAECSKNIVGFKNCCKSRAEGWGEGIFTECTDEEEILARKKDAGLTIEIGTYCYNEVAGKCTSEHVVYCVFDSKLGRIIRAAGNAQLGLGFGTPEHPNCRGLTCEEFQHINFSKIDFSEFYADIRNKQKIKLANEINPIIQGKLVGIKEKLNIEAKDKIKKADELRIRK